jgi:signal transduction histidine kinase
VDVDRDLFGLALRQLLDNAVKYSPAGSAIEVAASGGGGTIHLAVRNGGPPIPERERRRIFERFYRGGQAQGIPGTGMGLPIVRQIAQAHGGNVAVTSSERSTEFRVSLPPGDTA